MQAHTKPQLIALRIQELRPGMFVVPHGFLKQGIIRGESAVHEANFTLEVGPLHPDNERDCERLLEHGFTVVELPEDWKYGYSHERGDWREMIIRTAMKRLAAFYESNERKIPMQGYDKKLARAVLVALQRSFPHPVTNMELKHVLTPEPSDADLLTALEALNLHGYIDGKGLHESTSSRRKLVVMANIAITSESLRQLEGVAEQNSTTNFFQGDAVFNYGHAGAIGRNAVCTINYQATWKEIESDVNLDTLAVELALLRAELQKKATSRDDYKEVGLIAEAEEQAEKKDGGKVLAVLSSIGKNIIPIATRIGADVVLKMIGHSHNLHLPNV